MRGDVIRRICWLLALTGIVLAGVGLVVALPTLPGPSVPAARSDDSSRLERSYPLGERTLAKGGTAGTATVPTATRPNRVDDEGGDFPAWALLVAALGGLGALAWQRRRFTHLDGHWTRLRPRRRWSVGERGYRSAQSLGFRYSRIRDALVLRPLHGRFGPVLRLREPGVSRGSPARSRVAAMGKVAAPPRSTAHGAPAQRAPEAASRRPSPPKERQSNDDI